jgi:ATP-binding cassette, subfamily C (CFTR/MRP), member 1
MTRILNVFSRDVYVLDQSLGRFVSAALRTSAMVFGKIGYLISFSLLTRVGTIFVVCISFPLFTFALVPLIWFYRRIMIYYLATSRELWVK